LSGEPSFDVETLALLDRTREVRIDTPRPDGTRRTTIIWVVVDGADVFVRSYRGDRGYWWQEAMESPDDLELVFDSGRSIPVRAVSAVDEASVARCSAGFESKYLGNPSTPSMLLPMTLGTTLRLVPR
jgi:hypothetical protein